MAPPAAMPGPMTSGSAGAGGSLPGPRSGQPPLASVEAMRIRRPDQWQGSLRGPGGAVRRP